MTDLKLFIEEMRATSSSTEKSAIIARSSTFIHEVLEATYNPYKQYYTTSKTCLKNHKLVGTGSIMPLFEILNKLSSREITGHDAIKEVNRFTKLSVDAHLIYKIIDKDLDIRVGDKVINNAIPGLIPTFSVALAKEYEDGKCEWKDGWFASRKLDGVRCLARVNEEGKCTLFSRTGKEFTTLDKVKEAIEATGVTSITFDGEICLVDKDGNEDFQGVMKQLRRKDHQIQNPAYIIFDVLDNIDFDNAKGNIPLKTRLQKIRSWLALTGNNNSNILRYTEQVKIEDNNHFELWSEMSNQNGWEGVMLRKNVGYEGKRTKNLVKVKKFFDNEYKVVGFDTDNHEVVRDGKSVTMQMLSQVYIEHKGYKVKVGSGFTQEQRLKYMDGSIMGKTICVQYFSETENDKGGISLRFPTLKHIYDGKRDM
jgi:DNA ligase-1